MKCMDIKYYHEIRRGDGVVLSVDNIVAVYKIGAQAKRDKLMSLITQMQLSNDVDIQHWISLKTFSFHDNFDFKFCDGTSFWLGVGFVKFGKTDYGRMSIDFNPNKVAEKDALRTLLDYLNATARRDCRSIKRFDLAIDIPTQRKHVLLEKDRRAYTCFESCGALTEYLGAKSSTVGRVKLYDKTAESGLDYPLTRLELTLDPKMGLCDIDLPNVYVVTDYQTSLFDIRLTDTDRFILAALLARCGKLSDLGRGERNKMRRVLEQITAKITIDERDYQAIQAQLRGYLTPHCWPD